MTKYISIASGKGGVGKTTITINLATALAQLKSTVVILDANINSASQNVSNHLGFYYNKKTLQGVMNGKNSITDSLYIHPSGFRVALAVPLYYKENIVDTLHKINLDLFGKTEFVIIDCAAGVTNEAHSGIRSSDDVLIVTNLNKDAVCDTQNLIEFYKNTDINILGIVLNKVKGHFYEMPVESVKRMLKKPILSIVPHDEKIIKSLNLQHPVVYSYPHSPASKQFNELAKLFID